MNADQQLTLIRQAARTATSGSTTARLFQELDAHLSAGGTPPEAWREGPDAPGDIDLGPVGPGGEPWGWQGSDNTPPPPEGLAVFAHWSRIHNGINVEIDAPDGLPITVVINDSRMVSIIAGTTSDPTLPVSL